MPTESDSSKKSGESQRQRQGWFVKCATTLSNLSVRDRPGTPEGPNRPVVTVADAPKNTKRALNPGPGDSPKKPRRVTSFLASRNLPKQSAENNAPDMPSSDPRELFDTALGDSQAVNAYDAKHSALLQLEAQNAWDRDSKPSRQKNVDRIEVGAARIVRAIREYERRVTFGNLASEEIPGPETLDMGGQFLTNRQRINEESELHKIAIKVPKGSLLHVHFNSELHPERLLERARLIDNLYIRSIRPLLTQEDLDQTEMVLTVLDSSQVQPADIFSRTYPGGPTNWRTEEWKWRVWMPWKQFQDDFEKHFPGKHTQKETTIISEVPHCCSEPGQVSLHPAENWLRSKMVLSEEEAYGTPQTVNGVWARFNQATRCFKGLLNYEDVYKWYIGEAIDRMILENVMYAEMRPMLLDKSIPTNDGKGTIDNCAQMELIIEGVELKKRELEKRGELHKFPFGLKIIYCTPRSIPKKTMIEEMKQCIELKLKYPKLICGFDLVGAEDRKNHIGFYKEELVAFQTTCAKLGIKIPFLFHAGETLLDTGGSTDTDPNKSNLYDAVVLGAKRIGHGFSLMKHPHLVEKFKKTPSSPGICIELCPISNELLHLCRNIKEHPYPELLAAGIPCTVNSDNPSLFNNSMAHEFYQIMVGAPSMSLYSWKQLARWSIDYSCLSDEEKAEGRRILDSEWRKFCQDVVDKYRPIMTEDGEGDEVDEMKAKNVYHSHRS